MWCTLSPVFFEQAAKNVFLEEKLQVLQQQNEDLKERIDKNLAVSRSEDVHAGPIKNHAVNPEWFCF